MLEMFVIQHTSIWQNLILIMLRIQKKQTLKSLISEDFRKTQKSRYLEDETFLITHQELYFIAKNTFVVDVTFKVKIEYSLEL